MQLVRDRLVAAHKERSEPEKLLLFGTFPARSECSQIVQFAARGRLLHAERISQKCKMSFAKKRRDDKCDQDKQNPGRNQINSSSKRRPW